MIQTSTMIVLNKSRVIVHVSHDWLGTGLARISFTVIPFKGKLHKFTHYLTQDEVDSFPSTEMLARSLLS